MSTPASDPLAAAEDAFTAGDFRRARALLAAAGPPPPTASPEEASEREARHQRLQRALRFDPVHLALLAAIAAVWIYLMVDVAFA